jgi:hypothetical protein
MSTMALAFIALIGVVLIATYGSDDDDNEE